MKKPLINIVIPIYNVELYLHKCVDSVLSQTYENLRVILVDDGSPDNCPAICDEYAARDKRVRTVHRINGGLSAARNSGLSMLFEMTHEEQGEYIAFVDSDDYVAPDYIDFLYYLMISNDVDIAQCGHYIVYSTIRHSDKNSDHTTHTLSSIQALESLCYNSLYDVTVWNKLYKLRLFQDIRFPEGRIYEDTAVAHLLADLVESVAVNMTPKYYYLQRYDSTANGMAFHEKKFQFLQAGDEMADYVTRRCPYLEQAANVKRVFVRLSTLSQMVNCNYYDKKRITEMKRQVQLYWRDVLINNQAAIRDKLGILALLLGWPVYCILWKIYYKVVRRQK